MRLLKFRKREFEVKEQSKLDIATKKCAIISHRWGNNETNFQNMQRILQPQKTLNSIKLTFDNPKS